MKTQKTRNFIHCAASDDRELAAQALRGRADAFDALVAKYQRPVLTVVLRITREPFLAEDIAQEAFMRAYARLHTYNPKYKFSSWLFRIANNLAIDHCRKRSIPTVRMNVDRSDSKPTSWNQSPHRRLEHMELGRRLQRAIEGLRPEYRAATVLRHIEGRPYKEVAYMMGIPLGTAKTYIYRARRQLMKKLRGAWNEM